MLFGFKRHQGIPAALNKRPDFSPGKTKSETNRCVICVSPGKWGFFWQEIRGGSRGTLDLCQQFRPGYCSCLVLLPGMPGSAAGASAGTQQDPASVAEVGLVVLGNLSQVTPGCGRAERCVAIPPHQILPQLPRLTSQRGPGGGRMALGRDELLPAAASFRPRSCNSANKGASAPSVPARKGPGHCAGSHMPATTLPICHCTCRSREKSISVTTSSSERKGSAEGRGWRGSITARFPAATASRGHGRGPNKATSGIINEPWGARP